MFFYFVTCNKKFEVKNKAMYIDWEKSNLKKK